MKIAGSIKENAMRKIRINNDIDVHLTVKRDGVAEDFENKQVSVVMQVSYKKIPVTDFETDGNIIIFRFRAGEQRFLGLYSITVCVTDSGGGVNTVDKCDAFELVRCSCSAGGTDEPNIETVTLEYSLDLKTDAGGDASGGGTGTSDYNDLDNKPRINNVILSGNKTAEQLGLQPKGDYTTTSGLATALAGYVEKVVGKGLSTNDFTNALKQKLEGLSNYNDTAVQNAIVSINNRIDTLLGGSASDAIDTFREIESFLQGITDTETLTGLLNDLRTEMAGLVPDVSSFATENYVDTEIRNAISGIDTLAVEINSVVGFNETTVPEEGGEA